MDAVRAERDAWGLEAGCRYLNHGAFGATPREILAEQDRWRARMERQPARFFSDDLAGLLREAAAPLAGFVGTAPERLGLVENATAGINAVVRSLDFRPGDEILTTDHVYAAVRNLLRYVCRRSGAVHVEAPVGMPVADEAQMLAPIAARLSGRTRLAIIDHVASASAVRFPITAVAKLCREAGVPLLVDGAHAPGLLDLDVDRIGADWYIGNCHKWLCAPRGAAFIAVADRPTAEVHPVVISHSLDQGFAAEFDKVGTRDSTAWLTVPAAIALHQRLGGPGLRARNRALAQRAGLAVSQALGEPLGAAPDLFEAMVTVRVPGGLPGDWALARALRRRLWEEERIELPFMALAGSLWLRLSAQAYNEPPDYDGLAEAVRAVARAAGGAGC